MHAAQVCAEFIGRGDDDGFEGDERCRTGPHGTDAGDPQNTQHFGGAVAGFGSPRSSPARTIAAAPAASFVCRFCRGGPGVPIGWPDLADPDAGPSLHPNARPLRCDRVERPQAVRPAHEAAVTRHGRGHGVGLQRSAELIDSVRDLDVFGRINADRDLCGCQCHCGPSSDAGLGWHIAGSARGGDSTARGLGVGLLSGHSVSGGPHTPALADKSAFRAHPGAGRPVKK